MVRKHESACICQQTVLCQVSLSCKRLRSWRFAMFIKKDQDVVHLVIYTKGKKSKVALTVKTAECQTSVRHFSPENISSQFQCDLKSERTEIQPPLLTNFHPHPFNSACIQRRRRAVMCELGSAGWAPRAAVLL